MANNKNICAIFGCYVVFSVVSYVVFNNVNIISPHGCFGTCKPKESFGVVFAAAAADDQQIRYRPTDWAIASKDTFSTIKIRLQNFFDVDEIFEFGKNSFYIFKWLYIFATNVTGLTDESENVSIHVTSLLTVSFYIVMKILGPMQSKTDVHLWPIIGIARYSLVRKIGFYLALKI